MRGDTDLELVEKARSGDGKAFGRIVERHSAVVYAAVRSVLGGRRDIDDAVQETFIRVYTGLSSFAGRSALSSWIWSVARNHAINLLSKERLDIVSLDDTPELATVKNDPETLMARRAASEDIEYLLSGLEGNYREVIELRYLAGKKYHEIASILGLPEGTVKTLIHRARVRMRQMMKSRECPRGREE